MSLLAQTRELRRHLRVDYQRRAWCEHRDWTQYLAVTNLSHGGLFIQTPTPFLPGELLHVSFNDGSEMISFEVEVKWASRSRHVGVGCQIASFDEGEARYLDLIDRLSSSAR